MEKKQPIGICDLCGGPIPSAEWYTRRGPRLHCCTDCKNTANSRAGAPIRSRKAKARVARGEWQNPHLLSPPTSEQQSRRASLGRTREVEAGTWRNPALSQAARQKLSRPRKHRGLLHVAIEKLSRGLGVASLTDPEHRAWLKHQRALRHARLDEIRRYNRERYRRQQDALTPKEREAQRTHWREQNKRRHKG